MGFLHTPPELGELARTGPSTGRRAASTDAERVLNLQATAGNRAVTEALRRRVVQREPPPTRVGAPKSSDEETLDQVLARIQASMKFAERVAPMEVISATTAAEFSTGELDLGVERLWKRERLDFTKAARKHAATAAKSSEATGTQSPRIDPNRRYQLRRAVSLLASNYQKGNDLDEVAALAKRGSPYRSALTQEFGDPTIVLDPSAAKMRTAIFDAVLKMWTELPEGEVGELVVTFSGHGGGGFFSGVDGKQVSGDELKSLATLAADHDVHLVYIMDTCRAGLFVGRGQEETAKDLRPRIMALPEGARKPMLARLDYLTELVRTAFDVGMASHDVGSAARKEVKKGSDANRLAYFDKLVALSKQNTALRGALTAAKPGGVPEIEAVLAASEALGWSSLTAMAGRGAEVGSTLHAAARLLDAANDVINAALERLDADVRGAKPAGKTRR